MIQGSPLLLLLLPQTAPSFEFVETFDGDPAGPQAYSDPRFDLVVHSRDKETFAALEPMQAQHGPACTPPPELHTLDSYDDAVYRCKNHLMTAISAGGYGVVYVTPTSLVDFSNAEAIVRVDVSTLRTSSRDWWDLYLSPYEDHLVAPLEEWLPDLQGQPRRAIHVRMNFGSSSEFKISLWNDGVETQLSTLFQGYEAWLTPDAKQRSTFELRVAKDHLAFGMPEHDVWWFDGEIPELSFDQAVLQLGHHSYNPTKTDLGCPAGHDFALAGLVCGSANTWHWDDLRISSARPFTRLAADRRRVSSLDSDRTVRLDSPAPSGAELRFAGIGSIELSVDGGPFEPAVRRDGTLELAGQHDPGHFASYFHPLPVGSREIEFRFGDEDWWEFEKLARDLSVWSLDGLGIGCAGGAGVVPELIVPPALAGDPGFVLTMEQALADAPAFLAVSLGEQPPPPSGCGVGPLLAPAQVVVPSPGLSGMAITDGGGRAQFALPLLVGPSAVGLDLVAQAFAVDPGAELDFGPVQFSATATRRFALE